MRITLMFPELKKKQPLSNNLFFWVQMCTFCCTQKYSSWPLRQRLKQRQFQKVSKLSSSIVFYYQPLI